jgi:phenylpyruvate tautomerase PptA (4-oxalocrotonate tautomerase family)
MPLVNIDVVKGRPSWEIDEISEAVHRSMVELLDVPPRDRFQIVTEHALSTLRFDRHYLDINRDDQFVLIRISLAAGRATEAKSAFYARLSESLSSRVGLPPGDLAVVMVETSREDWSFGNGKASYLVLPPDPMEISGAHDNANPLMRSLKASAGGAVNVRHLSVVADQVHDVSIRCRRDDPQFSRASGITTSPQTTVRRGVQCRRRPRRDASSGDILCAFSLVRSAICTAISIKDSRTRNRSAQAACAAPPLHGAA